MSLLAAGGRVAEGELTATEKWTITGAVMLVTVMQVLDVTVTNVTDTGVNDRVDAAYRAKYGHYGARYIDPLIASRNTTLKLVPR